MCACERRNVAFSREKVKKTFAVEIVSNSRAASSQFIGTHGVVQQYERRSRH